MRVFTAVDIEKPGIQEKLVEVRYDLDYGFNKVDPEKMHVTLQFFQDVTKNEMEEIKMAMEHVELDPFQLKLRGVGVFPSKKHIRVVWAGTESEEIFELKEQVSNHGISEDNDHEFHPHITLARVQNIGRRNKKEFRKKLEKLETRHIGSTNVNKVKLFESVHNGRSTEYKVLKEEEL